MGVQTWSTQAPLKFQAPAFGIEPVFKHPTISAVTGMGGHRFLVLQYEVAAHASHGAEKHHKSPKLPGLPRRCAPRNDKLSATLRSSSQ
jgi:hypothetical protein